MKKLYLLLVIAIPFNLLAQSETRVDSVDYYRKQLGVLWRNAIDSFRNSGEYKTAYTNFMNKVKVSNNYGSFTIFMDLVHSDFRQFNKMLAQDGFPPLEEIGYRVGFGFGRKFDHFMVDIYLASIGIGNRSKKGIERVSSSFSNAFLFDLGYDVLNSSKISLYPYAGISGRFSQIKYHKRSVANPNYTSITNMLSDGNDVQLESTRIGYQLGVGIDMTLFQNKARTSKTILFVKGGMNRPIWKDKYKHDDLPAYQPNIKNGDWMLTVGFKFAFKN